MAIATPLCWEVRGIGPFLQHEHDTLIEAIVEQDRHSVFYPEGEAAQVWLTEGRPAVVGRLTSLRAALGHKPITRESGPKPPDKIVGEGSWIAEAQTQCIALRALEGVPAEEFKYRMQWAWHRGSVVTHAGFATEATPDGLAYTYLGAEDASALIRCAVELAVAAQRVLGGIWSAGAAPRGFPFSAEHRVPKSPPPYEPQLN